MTAGADTSSASTLAAQQGMPGGPAVIQGDEREQGRALGGAGIIDQAAHQRGHVLALEGDATDLEYVLEIRC
jgi:hypothetical protein